MLGSGYQPWTTSMQPVSKSQVIGILENQLTIVFREANFMFKKNYVESIFKGSFLLNQNLK